MCLCHSFAEHFITSYSEEWKKERSKYVKALRGSGFGTSTAEAKIQAEIEVLIKQLQKSQDANEEGINLSEPLSTAAVNFMCGILFNEHYETDDPAFLHLKHLIKEMLNFDFAQMGMLDMLPVWLSKLMMPSLFKEVPARLNTLRQVVVEKIKEHQKSHTPGEPRDFIDVLLDERAGKDINYESMADSCVATLPDATDNLPLAVEWMLVYVTKHPEVQAKVHSAIDDVVGKDRKPTLADKPNLPYLEAVMLESLRLSTPVVMLPYHAVNKNVKLRGYNIPKHAVIMGNVAAVHFDPKVFPDPYQFKPERFINTDGKLFKVDTIMPFGIGKFLQWSVNLIFSMCFFD